VLIRGNAPEDVGIDHLITETFIEERERKKSMQSKQQKLYCGGEKKSHQNEK